MDEQPVCIYKKLLDDDVLPMNDDRIRKMGCYGCAGRRYHCEHWSDTLIPGPDEMPIKERE